jgi:adenylate cyclase, class 2
LSAHVESEIKLRAADVEVARDALRRLGASLVRPRHFEENVLFDDERHALRAGGKLLRLRRAAGAAVLTFKAPSQAVPGIKTREEVESGVEDPDALRAILEGVGLRPVFRYQKYREGYAWRDAEIVLDETPVGIYLEIEGPASTIQAAAEALGYQPADYISESYAGLFLASGGKGDMVFR